MKNLSLIVLTLVLGSFAKQVNAVPLEGLRDINGKAIQHQSAKNKQLVVFWATWCPTCKEKLSGVLPQLNAKSDVEVIAINTDKEMSRVQHYIDKNKVSLPVWFDNDKKLRQELKIFSVPAWAVYQRASEKAEWTLVDSQSAFENEKINKALGGNYL